MNIICPNCHAPVEIKNYKLNFFYTCPLCQKQFIIYCNQFDLIHQIMSFDTFCNENPMRSWDPFGIFEVVQSSIAHCTDIELN